MGLGNKFVLPERIIKSPHVCVSKLTIVSQLTLAYREKIQNQEFSKEI